MDQRTAIEIVKKYLNFLKINDFKVQKAFIFGSYANGKFNNDSDIDLAIVFNNVPNSFTLQIQLMKIGRKFITRIEPHPFDEKDFNSSNPFANEILVTGIKVA